MRVRMKLGWSVCSFLLLSAFFVLTAVAGQDDNSEKGKKDDSNYYEIYSAIDILTKLTKHRTFYELLGVEPDADDETIGRAFRKASLAYHPDKFRHRGISPDKRTQELSQLVQLVGTLFRSERGRRDYDWVLNEAPAWHRQSVYMMRRLVPSSKLSLSQVAIIVLAFSVGLQLVAQWIGYLTSWYMIFSSRWALQEMGEKEVKRMRKRMAGADPAFLAMSNSAYHAILLAESPRPPLPSPLKLWIFALPMAIVKALTPQKFKKS